MMTQNTADVPVRAEDKPTPGMTRSITPELIAHINFRKGRVMAIMQYPHQGDQHLFTVLVKIGSGYVTWDYNADDGGFYHGHYFDRPDEKCHILLNEAMQDFSNRLMRRTF